MTLPRSWARTARRGQRLLFLCWGFLLVALISYQPGFVPASVSWAGIHHWTRPSGDIETDGSDRSVSGLGQRPRGNGEISEWPQSQLLLYDRHLHLLVNQWHLWTWCSLKTFCEYFKCVLYVHGHKALGAIISMNLFFNFPTTCKSITSKLHPLALCSLHLRTGAWQDPGLRDGANPSPPLNRYINGKGAERAQPGAAAPVKPTFSSRATRRLPRVDVKVTRATPSLARTAPQQSGQVREQGWSHHHRNHAGTSSVKEAPDHSGC